MGLRSFIDNSIRLLRYSTKPGRSELWLSIKICLLGVSLIGLVGFIVRVIAFLVSLA